VVDPKTRSKARNMGKGESTSKGGEEERSPALDGQGEELHALGQPERHSLGGKQRSLGMIEGPELSLIHSARERPERKSKDMC